LIGGQLDANPKVTSLQIVPSPRWRGGRRWDAVEKLVVPSVGCLALGAERRQPYPLYNEIGRVHGNLGELVYGLHAPESERALQRYAVDRGGVMELKKPCRKNGHQWHAQGVAPGSPQASVPQGMSSCAQALADIIGGAGAKGQAKMLSYGARASPCALSGSHGGVRLGRASSPEGVRERT
jgi:hypothetical protein